MPRKAAEPEHFVYIVLAREEPEGSYRYRDDFFFLEAAKDEAEKISEPTRIVRGRKATVLRFLKRLGRS